MTTRFSGHLLTGNHAARPAASAVPDGTLYSCSTHSLIYQSDTSAWSTWATLGGGAPAAHATSHQDGGSDEIDVTGLTGAGGGGGSDLVQVTSGAGSIRIPALSGDRRKLPASPNGSDIEFDAT